ncbi:MAG: ribulose-phosphate 3-epimerase [Anaerolinea sp.]|nr:ribulose-phosphate 3-epimerase [Anaerolinea sp.]
MKPVISASILAADFSHLADQIHQAEAAGADWIHIDVMDGHFVPPISMGPMVVEACKRITTLPLDVHLMIENPESQLEAFAKAGASIITVQQEACPHLHRTLDSIHELGCQAGVALNPSTSEILLTYILQQIDLILVMTVNPGFGGQTFIAEMLEKIARVNGMLADLKSQAYLQVDGGINSSNIRLVQAAGANNFVAGSTIFANPNGISAGIGELKGKLEL